MPLQGKKVSVLGIGKSGYESAVFLRQNGYEVFCSELGDTLELRARLKLLADLGIEGEVGGHDFARVLSSDWVLVSPGIPPTAPVYQKIKAAVIPMISEIEAASWFSRTPNIISVTGTAGKTTVTTLITRVLNACGRKAISCGNIGNPWISELNRIGPEDYVVLELSSFQLMHCLSFRPKIGILLNVSANHQDWHKDFEEYVSCKLNMFRHQKNSDYAIFRAIDKEAFFPDFKFSGIETPFGFSRTGNPNEEVVRKIAAMLNCPALEVERAITSFEGVEHRMEKVLELNGVTFINDSKCTTTASLAWALEKFPDQSVVLIAGGHPKSNDFDLAKELLRRKVKKAILIGEARPLLVKAWQYTTELVECGNFPDSIKTAFQSSSKGDVVLLSPACASFDMFKNYIERGDIFKSLVRELNREVNPTVVS